MVKGNVPDETVVEVTPPGPLKLVKIKGTALQREFFLQADDVIVAVNGKHWSQIGSIENTVRTALDMTGRPILATVVRDKNMFSVFLSKPFPKGSPVLAGDEAQEFNEFKPLMAIEHIRTLSNYSILADGQNEADVLEMRKSLLAMIFPPLWLIGRRLWEPLAAFTCAIMTAFVIHQSLGLLIYFFMCVYVGVRQVPLGLLSMQREGMRQRMIVAARDEQEAQLIALRFNEKLKFKFTSKEKVNGLAIDVEIV